MLCHVFSQLMGLSSVTLVQGGLHKVATPSEKGVICVSMSMCIEGAILGGGNRTAKALSSLKHICWRRTDVMNEWIYIHIQMWGG